MSRFITRVCYVIPSLGVGGTEQQLVHLVRGLVDDHEITVICTNRAGALAGDVRRLGGYVRVLDAWGGWDWSIRGKIRRVFRKHRPDIVHSFMFGFDLPVNRAARRAGVPVVLSSRRQLAAWKRPRHVRIQRKANALVDVIVANSHAVRDFAVEQEKAPPSRFRVIPNGIRVEDFQCDTPVDLLRQRYGIPPDTRVVGILANFSPVKDHFLFVDIAKELIARRPDVHFLMVGSGPLLRKVQALIRQDGMGKRFSRLSTLHEVPDVLAVMDVSVLCSQLEGFPNAVLESMAARVPVVAAKVGGIPELMKDGDTGTLVDTRDPRRFADAIERTLDNPDAARAMTARAFELVRATFPIDRMVDAHRKLYAEMLAAAYHRAG